MRALAQYIMRGRIQASVVAFFGSLLPLLSPATVSLVTLSKGLAEGSLILLWGCLPLLIAFYVSGVSPMITLATSAGMVVVLMSSEVLRQTLSWSRTLLVLVFISAVGSVVLNLLFSDSARELEALVADMFRQLQEQGETGAAPFQPGRTFLLGVIAYVVALTSVACLVLARWWQAALYNQGGFQREFHQLRFSPAVALSLIVGVTACYMAPLEYGSWAGLLGLPLFLAGIGLVHFTVAYYQIGVHWLAVFYVGLVIIGPLSLVLVGLGLLDSILNIRTRLGKGES